MQKKRVSTTSTNISGFVARVKDLYSQGLTAQRGAGMPKTGIIANFDPDQRGFITPAMQGLTNVQLGNGAMVTNTLVAHPEFGVVSGYQNPDTQTDKFPFPGDRQLRPVPGQATLVYPVASANGSVATSFIRGGKAQPYREYPSYMAQWNYHGYGGGIANLFFQTGASHIVNSGLLGTWYNNSPLPPGARWGELNDVRYANTSGALRSLGQLISLADLASLYGLTIGTLSQLLPQDQDGNVKVNYKPLTGVGYALHPEIQADDSYWTGTVRNPLDWTDAWWDGSNHNVDKTLMATWLTAHPGAKFP
jgi:hypothetical protein